MPDPVVPPPWDSATWIGKTPHVGGGRKGKWVDMRKTKEKYKMKGKKKGARKSLITKQGACLTGTKVTVKSV